MRKRIIKRIEELKKHNGVYFDKRTYFSKPLNDYDIYNIDDQMLIEIFEQMVRINYTQR